MKAVKVLIFFIGLLCVTNAQNSVVRIPILGPVIGAVEDAVEGAVHTAADVVVEGEDLLVNRAGVISNIIQNALQRFKTLMVESIPLLGLPRLEPLSIEHIDIDIKHDIGKFKGSLDNIQVLNLSRFDTRSVNVHGFLPPYDVDLHLFFETLTVRGDYEINANVGDIFNIYGKGPFQMILHDLDTFVRISKIRVGKTVQFDDIKLNITLGSLTSQLTNLMGGGDSEKLFNKVIEDIAPEAVQVLWPEISEIVEPKIKEVVNTMLSKIPLKDLISLLG